MRPFITGWVIAIWLVIPALAAENNALLEHRWSEQKNQVRLVFELSYNPEYQLRQNPTSGKLQIELHNTVWKSNSNPKPLQLIKALKVTPKANGLLVIDATLAKSEFKTKSFILPRNSSHHYRLVIDIDFITPTPSNKTDNSVIILSDQETGYLKRPETKSVTQAAKTSALPTPTANKILEPKTTLNDANKKQITRLASEQISKPKRKPVIVIDPGHGGRDPGAISPYNKIKEKNITLTYAKKLKQHIEQQYGYKVYLTRSNDRYISLAERVKLTQKYNADLFLSLHADSNPNRQTAGLSVYTLSEKASDNEAALLALDHDHSEKVRHLKDHEDDVNSVLVSMLNRETRNSAAEFANILVKELAQKAKLLQNTHRFARFRVLKQVSSPAVLVELGYLSNRQEEKLLTSDTYLNKLVSAIGRAVHLHCRRQKLA